MMNNFSSLNKIFGWAVFAVALVVYSLTLESSVSLWDCGEFISAAYKLQVVHPPGAPLFLMVGRLFALLSPDPAHVGFWVNMLSAVSSAGCVMFTFWITTHFAQKLVAEDNANRNTLIIGAGVVAALTNTFLDSFWFSAVEAEVYAMSSFFTSLTFWAILRWDKQSNDSHNDRWLVFIAFVTGLALGTHMLNLLVIPTVCLAYYFKRFTITRNGVLMAFGAALVALGFVMKIVYPGIPWLLAVMDKMFVNSFHLPFYSGSIFALILIFGGIAALIWYTAKTGRRNWNLLVISAGFIILGYSSYAMVVIRSLANPAIDMNNPEDPYKFYGYITREQYGDRPLVKGPYFNAPTIDYKENPPKWYKGDSAYEATGATYEPVYDEEYMTLFPRMGKSNKSGDARGFRQYGGMREVQNRIDELNQQRQNGQPLTDAEKQELEALEYEKPSMGNNIRYFITYQINHMYWRYFLWNFVGRFNDQQAVTGLDKFDGNWYSGLPFIDRFFSGPSQGMPDYYKNQKGKNAYFFLPFLLGILGMILHFGKGRKDFWLVMTLFLFTGVLINVYMNQPPYEPRERDYSLVGSFQTFCIWVGLGVIYVAELLKKYLNKSSAITAAVACTALVPVNMAYQNWDDHDRSGRYIGLDMAKNFLNSLEPNAILFCNGDNDTYPLWYAQNVEGIRTDVRIINESLLPTEWYSSVLLDKVYKSDPLPLTVTKNDLKTGSFDYGIEIDRNNYKSARPLRSIIKELLAENQKGMQNVWHGGKFFVKVDKEAVKKARVVNPKDYNLIADSIEVNIGGNYVNKGDLVVYDLIATNAEQGWKRPIYFTSVSGYEFNSLNKYLQLEGLVYRFVPINGGAERGQPLKIADYQLYNNLVNNFKYYGMKEKKNFYLDDKAAYVPNDMQQTALSLANYYINELEIYKRVKADVDSGKTIPPPYGFTDTKVYLQTMADSIPVYKARGVQVLKKMLVEIPENVMPLHRELKFRFGMAFMQLGEETMGKKMLTMAVEENSQFAGYFSRWPEWGPAVEVVERSKYFVNQIISYCEQNGHKDWAGQFKKRAAGL